MKRLAWITLAQLPPALLTAVALRPQTHSDLGLYALPIALPFLFLAYLVIAFAVETKRPFLKATWPLFLSSTLLLSIWATAWPLHLAFRMAEPELDRLAQQFASHKIPKLPQRAGLFLIHDGGLRADLEDGDGNPVVYLTVVPEPSGPTLFVRSTSSGGFHPWSETKLSPEWILVKQD